MKSRYTISCVVLCAILMIAFVSFSLKVLNVQAYTGLSETDEKSLYNETIKYGTQEILPDCPTREKVQYLGDFCVPGRAQAILTGDTTY